jgi:hypothetical protein
MFTVDFVYLLLSEHNSHLTLSSIPDTFASAKISPRGDGFFEILNFIY